MEGPEEEEARGEISEVEELEEEGMRRRRFGRRVEMGMKVLMVLFSSS